MAVDVDKFMESQKPVVKFYDTTLTQWLLTHRWIRNGVVCNNFYRFYGSNFFLSLIRKLTYEPIYSFSIGDRLYEYKTFYRGCGDKGIDLPPEATDEECIEIVKRLMERFG